MEHRIDNVRVLFKYVEDLIDQLGHNVGSLQCSISGFYIEASTPNIEYYIVYSVEKDHKLWVEIIRPETTVTKPQIDLHEPTSLLRIRQLLRSL